jgi:hypothetical protein
MNDAGFVRYMPLHISMVTMTSFSFKYDGISLPVSDILPGLR